MRVFQSQSPPPTCFFCLTTLSSRPRNVKSFKCPHCSCWNRYDEAGQIVSDEPAMRDESLNTVSFAKRGMFVIKLVIRTGLSNCLIASPSKHRLPTTYGKGPFCHTCLTNQTLLMNMLSNYLPSSDVCYQYPFFELFTSSSRTHSMKHVCLSCQHIPRRCRVAIHRYAVTASLQWTRNFKRRNTWRGRQRWADGSNAANMLGRNGSRNSDGEDARFLCGEPEVSYGL